MSAHELEFWPGAFDADAIAVNTHCRLVAFNHYVEQELEAAQLFSAITLSLTLDRPNEFHAETDITAGRVGLEMAALTGEIPERLTNPNTPLTQQMYYPPVNLPDGNVAILSESIDRGTETDNSETATRIPWLYIIAGDMLTDFQNGEVDYLADVATEAYCRSNLDDTGESDDEPPYASAQRLFFQRPRSPKKLSALEKQKQELIDDQEAYLKRLRAIADIVLIGTEH